MLGVFTSLPILWGESPNISDMLAKPPPPHWVKGVLERHYRIAPLNVVEPGELRLLLMAQPRPLSPTENVALDQWVRDGGRLLLLADPMLTWDSVFALGDRRRPQDIVLLSPILSRWGLELRFDEGQPGNERTVAGIPVRLHGTLALTGQGHAARCRIEHYGLIASCRIGRGQVTVVADAALLEPDAEGAGTKEASKAAVFESLLQRAFGM